MSEEKAKRLRPHAILGLGIILASEMLLIAGNIWVKTYFTPLVWTGYIILIDALVAARNGKLPPHGAAQGVPPARPDLDHHLVRVRRSESSPEELVVRQSPRRNRRALARLCMVVRDDHTRSIHDRRARRFAPRSSVSAIAGRLLSAAGPKRRFSSRAFSSSSSSSSIPLPGSALFPGSAFFSGSRE